jgi:hypothetical protein
VPAGCCSPLSLLHLLHFVCETRSRYPSASCVVPVAGPCFSPSRTLLPKKRGPCVSSLRYADSPAPAFPSRFPAARAALFCSSGGWKESVLELETALRDGMWTHRRGERPVQGREGG